MKSLLHDPATVTLPHNQIMRSTLVVRQLGLDAALWQKQAPAGPTKRLNVVVYLYHP